MWGLGKCVCSLKIKLRVYSCELDGFWVLLLYGLITNWKQARLTLPRPIPNSEHVYASLTDTCGPRQSSDRLNTSEIKNEEHKSFTRTWKVVVFWVRRRTRTDQRKVWHRNRTQETKIGRAIAAWCRWPAAGVFVCVRACRQVCGGGVAYKLPAAGKVRVTCSAPVSAPLWKNIIQCLLMSLFTYRSAGQKPRVAERRSSTRRWVGHYSHLRPLHSVSSQPELLLFFILLFVGWLVSGCVSRESRLQ